MSESMSTETKTFDQPTKVDALDAAFGGANINDLLPPYDEIPEEFKQQTNKWVLWQQQWFFSGLERAPKPKDGIDGNAAMRHLQAIQGSFDPKHEHKEAGVAYLASKWFESP